MRRDVKRHDRADHRFAVWGTGSRRVSDDIIAGYHMSSQAREAEREPGTSSGAITDAELICLPPRKAGPRLFARFARLAGVTGSCLARSVPINAPRVTPDDEPPFSGEEDPGPSLA